VTDDDDPWWTASRVAEYLGVHRATVARIPRDDLPYAEHGGRGVRRYDPSAVRAFRALHDTSSDASLAGLLAEHSRRLDEHDAALDEIRRRLGEGEP
jgi:hypothetical protein